MLTILQIAQTLGVSKATARRYLQQIDAKPQENRQAVNGKLRTVLVYDDSVVDTLKASGLCGSSEPVRTSSSDFLTSSEPVKAVHAKLEAAQHENGLLQAQLDGLQRENDLLRAQLQDAQSDKARLYDALGQTQQALQQAQVLQAQAERKLLDLREPEPAPERRSWWQRLFDR